MTGTADECAVDLFWLPLGAGPGAQCVRFSGRTFEALVAWREHRAACPLFHSALEVTLDGQRFTIEMAPAWSGGPTDRGVVGQGPVGIGVLGRSPLFRYEVRCWRGGSIPDAAEAVAGPQRLSTDRSSARRLLGLVPSFPTATWGRDELRTGEMWNSNSLVAWLLHRTGYATAGINPPDDGRAPGWQAGLVVAAREEQALRTGIA